LYFSYRCQEETLTKHIYQPKSSRVARKSLRLSSVGNLGL
jgi:hypothetical protein